VTSYPTSVPARSDTDPVVTFLTVNCTTRLRGILPNVSFFIDSTENLHVLRATLALTALSSLERMSLFSNDVVYAQVFNMTLNGTQSVEELEVKFELGEFVQNIVTPDQMERRDATDVAIDILDNRLLDALLQEEGLYFKELMQALYFFDNPSKFSSVDNMKITDVSLEPVQVAQMEYPTSMPSMAPSSSAPTRYIAPGYLTDGGAAGGVVAGLVVLGVVSGAYYIYYKEMQQRRKIKDAKDLRKVEQDPEGDGAHKWNSRNKEFYHIHVEPTPVSDDDTPEQIVIAAPEPIPQAPAIQVLPYRPPAPKFVSDGSLKSKVQRLSMSAKLKLLTPALGSGNASSKRNSMSGKSRKSVLHKRMSQGSEGSEGSDGGLEGSKKLTVSTGFENAPRASPSKSMQRFRSMIMEEGLVDSDLSHSDSD
jgi:hypothetical protein